MYASEGSLDTYMFNLLQNKQTFINQLKTGSLGTRIIDEGAMDADGAMNYSEFVAILSGNNDLLEKAKLEKKIFALESEYKGYKKQIHSTEIGLRYLEADFETDQNRLEGIKKDWAYINEHLPANEEGIRPNPIQLDNFPHNNNIEAIGNHLIKMDKYKRSFDYEQIGNLLDFKILMKTEKFNDRIYNKFFVEGSCKYSFNNGNLAETPELAATNFIRAFDRIPKLISDYESNLNEIEIDITKMKAIVNSPWKKEKQLKEMKVELDRLERKIQHDLNNQDKIMIEDNIEKEKVEILNN